METKTCKQCGVVKSVDDFYPAHPGARMARCKACFNEWRRERAARRTPEERRQVNERNRRSRQKHPERCRQQVRTYQARNPEKHAAQAALNAAVQQYKIWRQPCEVCGEIEAQGHHEDYSKPLEVRWLCSLCHTRLHADRRRKGV